MSDDDDFYVKRKHAGKILRALLPSIDFKALLTKPKRYNRGTKEEEEEKEEDNIPVINLTDHSTTKNQYNLQVYKMHSNSITFGF